MIKSWNNEESSITDKMRGMLKPDAPLKNRIHIVQTEFDGKINKLNEIMIKLKNREDLYFGKIVDSRKNGHVVSAQAYANELAHIRKVSKMMSTAKTSLEQVKVRLETISEFGELVVTLSPCMAVIKDLGPSLSGIMPSATASMQDLSNMLGDIMSSSSVQDKHMIMDSGINSETRAILDEAQSVVANETKSTIPDLPDESQSVVANETKSTIPDLPDSLKHQIVSEKRDILI